MPEGMPPISRLQGWKCWRWNTKKLWNKTRRIYRKLSNFIRKFSNCYLEYQHLWLPTKIQRDGRPESLILNELHDTYGNSTWNNDDSITYETIQLLLLGSLQNGKDIWSWHLLPADASRDLRVWLLREGVELPTNAVWDLSHVIYLSTFPTLKKIDRVHFAGRVNFQLRWRTSQKFGRVF